MQGALIADVTLATLVKYDLDMKLRQLILSFDEVMDPSTVRVGGIALQDAAGGSSDLATTAYSFTDSLVTTTAPGTTISINISDHDFLQIGLQSGLATAAGNTYLNLAAATLDDVFGRDVVAVAANRAQLVNAYTRDSIVPTLTQSYLNMSTMELLLVFSEAVNSSTFDSTAITLQPTHDVSFGGEPAPEPEPEPEPESVVNLAAGVDIASTDVYFSADLTSCVIKLNNADEDGIKKDTSLATSTDTTFLAFQNLVRDLAGNVMATVGVEQGVPVTGFSEDEVKPELTSFSINMDTGCLMLSFSEVVNASSVDPSKFSLQEVQDSTASDTSTP
jgi:hypothetical protein